VRALGIDIGSRTTKVVMVEDRDPIFVHTGENSFDPLDSLEKLIRGMDFNMAVATGYGRSLFARRFNCEVISEISAFAAGARAEFAGCRTVLDIGGQDTKVISLDEGGRILKFDMNDKCAAGTGRFLEIIAMALGYKMDEFGRAAINASFPEKISSMCTVFAESEVISLLHGGRDRAGIALGVHQSIALRSAAMVKKLPAKHEIVFAGGVALNPCMKILIETALKMPISVPSRPQVLGAFGCALHALNKIKAQEKKEKN